MRPQATATRVLENDRVIATEWRFAPGAETGWHRHRYDYVIIALTAGQLTAESKEGTVARDLRCGETYARPEGVEHNIFNSGPAEFAFIEIELKS